ncbi:LysE family translocator [Shimia biformata]|uniref:LysE family translocator n=1 Tax=Shimia biformata TaxID=1294299 RepID=UPI00194E5C9F|nr:LysE family translocator [Shimia biformata]
MTTFWAGLDPLFGFVFLGLFSPGPNVILLTTSGARFGFRATLPHLFGVVLGVGIIAALTALGIGALLLAMPVLEAGLRIAAAVWMLWMAWKLWVTAPPSTDTKARPFTFFQAVLFQWVNPKIWAVALAASSAYPSGLPVAAEALRMGLAFSGFNLFVCLFWSGTGAGLRYLLAHPQVWRIFARVMAAVLAAFAVSLVI